MNPGGQRGGQLQSHLRSLATVQNCIAQAVNFFRNIELGPFCPGVYDHVKASNRGGLVVSLLIAAFTNLPFNRI